MLDKAPSSEDEIPLDPNELTTVPTNSLDALPISEELRPASSRFDTEPVVIFLKMVSFAFNPESTELSGRYWFRPFIHAANQVHFKDGKQE